MKMSNGALTVFPTEPAKRRVEHNAVLKSGILDTSRLFTQKKLMNLCEQTARRAGLLAGRTPGTAETRLLLEQAAEAGRLSPGQPLARLSPAARAGLLGQLIEKFAFLAENESALISWLLAREPQHKLHGFGRLLEAWRSICDEKNIADRFAVNRALLQLIESGKLPPELQNGIHFRAVRWFNPFEERLVAALKVRLGAEQVQRFSVLPAAHTETADDRLCAMVRAKLGNEEEWTSWAEDFADAYEIDDGNILGTDARERVSFLVSAHPYGEIEDAARRIAAEIETGTEPHQIALIVRDVGPYTDIIPDVFQRFGIPYHFRRGTPASALPSVKALLALLAFPHNRSRDRLCDLLLSPSVSWPGVDDPEGLVTQIRKTEPPIIHRLPKELRGFFQGSTLSEQIHSIIEQHGLDLPEEVLNLIEELGAIDAPPLPAERMTVLLENLLDNTAIKDPADIESGVWVVNPMDVAGLRFESVFIAGMDDRSFPQIPKADALLNAAERKALRAFLEERKIPCPRLALSETGEALIQEEILFLTALGSASERLCLSYTRADADGKERAPGEFYERMRGLAECGDPAHGKSFHTILPPDTVRAEDEARQTAAYLNPPPAEIQQATAPRPALQQWLKDNPEFSATSLETLARNHFVFFLEKILSIKPDRTHEDDTDPMDRGTLVHDILELVYTAITERSDLYAAPSCTSGLPPASWRMTQQKTDDAIPLAVFDPARTDELLTLARDIAENEFAKAERRPSRHLGHPAVWQTEKKKLLQIIENFIRMECETAQTENRFPALFEMKFDAKHNLPVTLRRNGEEIRLKGKIDRIDLIFDADGELERLLVIDYKSKSRTDSVETLEKKIGRNLDCQLALYTFAAQQFFFGEHNTPELNQKVQAVYHLQERDLKKMTNHFEKKRIAMTPELTGTFLETLFTNIRKLRSGDLSTEPLIAGYEDYSHICRTVAIDPKDLLKEL